MPNIELFDIMVGFCLFCCCSIFGIIFGFRLFLFLNIWYHSWILFVAAAQYLAL
jgi:hypothetical protein